jgi:hypothetical protein
MPHRSNGTDLALAEPISVQILKAMSKAQKAAGASTKTKVLIDTSPVKNFRTPRRIRDKAVRVDAVIVSKHMDSRQVAINTAYSSR